MNWQLSWDQFCNSRLLTWLWSMHWWYRTWHGFLGCLDPSFRCLWAFLELPEPTRVLNKELESFRHHQGQMTAVTHTYTWRQSRQAFHISKAGHRLLHGGPLGLRLRLSKHRIRCLRFHARLQVWNFSCYFRDQNCLLDGPLWLSFYLCTIIQLAAICFLEGLWLISDAKSCDF